MKNYYIIVIVMLIVLAVFLAGLIIWQTQKEKKPLQPVLQENVEDLAREPEADWIRSNYFSENTFLKEFAISVGENVADIENTSLKEFAISVGENVHIFGIAQDDPYYGEPPAALITTEEVENGGSFEVWGDVVSVDLNHSMIYILTDYARSINTPFTPRGAKISFQDIKKGDRIVASGLYDESGEADYGNMQFIQISPSVEEIRLLREAQGK